MAVQRVFPYIVTVSDPGSRGDMVYEMMQLDYDKNRMNQ